MDSEALKSAVEMARRVGMTPKEAVILYEMAGGVAGGDASSHWILIAIDLAMDKLKPTQGLMQ